MAVTPSSAAPSGPIGRLRVLTSRRFVVPFSEINVLPAQNQVERIKKR